MQVLYIITLLLFTSGFYNCQTDSSPAIVELETSSSTSTDFTSRDTDATVTNPSEIDTSTTTAIDSTVSDTNEINSTPNVTMVSEEYSINTTVPDTNLTSESATTNNVTTTPSSTTTTSTVSNSSSTTAATTRNLGLILGLSLGLGLPAVIGIIGGAVYYFKGKTKYNMLHRTAF